MIKWYQQMPTFFIMPVFLLLKVVYLLSLFSMNSILILTLPFVFFPGLGPSLCCGSDVFLSSESLSLSESRPASPLDLFKAGDSTTKGPCVPLRAAGLSSTNCMVFILAAGIPSDCSDSLLQSDNWFIHKFVCTICQLDWHTGLPKGSVVTQALRVPEPPVQSTVTGLIKCSLFRVTKNVSCQNRPPHTTRIFIKVQL